MVLDFDNSQYTQAEHDAITWLGTRNRWLDVTITRRSGVEYDLSIKGTQDIDDGYDYTFDAPVSNGGVTQIQGQRQPRGFPLVQARSFSAWFVLAALREFWAMGLITCPHEDWSFIRDRYHGENWAVFRGVVAKYQSEPYLSRNLIDCCYYVWGAINEDGHEFTDNDDAIESILDADRLTMAQGPGYDGEAANEEVLALDALHGTTAVASALGKVLRLV